jgi:hypothetical protein
MAIPEKKGVDGRTKSRQDRSRIDGVIFTARWHIVKGRLVTVSPRRKNARGNLAFAGRNK